MPEAERVPPLDGSTLKIFLPDVSSTVGSAEDVPAAPEFADFFIQLVEQANSAGKNTSPISFDLSMNTTMDLACSKLVNN